MSNPFLALDLSDDENITVVKGAKAEAPSKKPAQQPASYPKDAKPHAPRSQLKKEEADLQQKKKGGAGHRGNVQNPDVPHPGEKAKLGLKKEEHVRTHKQEGGRGRQHDRHSAQPRRDSKKGGGGGHNWGKTVDDAPLPPKTPEAGDAAEEEAVVEEDPTLTLEEYEKMKALKRTGDAFSMKEARKVSSSAEGVQVYKKGEKAGEDDNYIKLGEEHDAKKKPGHTKHKEKQFLDINFKVGTPKEDAPRSGGRGDGARGGRGGGAPRGRGDAARGRGGGPDRASFRNKEERTAGASRLDMGDQSAFPKLGAS